MTKHSRALRASGAVLAATTTLGFFAPAANASAPASNRPTHNIGQKNPQAHLKVVKSAPATAFAATTVVKTAPTQTTHVVRSGETLWGISRQYSTTVDAIASANGIGDPSYLRIGQKLVIPGSQGAAATQAAPAAPSAESSVTAQHVVSPGETLSGIASRYGTSSSQLAALNGLSDANRIYVGQVLSVSGSAPAQSQQSADTSKVGNTFLHYTYSDETNAAANANKSSLDSGAVPSTAQMQSIIRDTAIQMGVDPRLALAHAQVESHFDQSAVSPANAVGAMQVIPSSGEWASQMVGRPLNLLDPHDNAVAGVAIIRWLQNNASSMDQGIAGYYQGLGGVRKYGMYSDTVDYVNKVHAAMANY
ncbi:LysM peptidoglycan-binding domain-containing protein [Actinomycetaceae bacterium L2_0104]